MATSRCCSRSRSAPSASASPRRASSFATTTSLGSSPSPSGTRRFCSPSTRTKSVRSLSTEAVFELVVSNRSFDGGAMAAWTDHENHEMGMQNRKRRKSTRRARQRPMLKKWKEWWRATGMTSYGGRKPAPQCGSYDRACEPAADFFDKRTEFREWEAKLRQKIADAECVKECKSSLNFALLKGWMPDLSSMQIGKVLRKIRAEHGQYGSVELMSWVRGMSPEDLCSEVLAVACQLSM